MAQKEKRVQKVKGSHKSLLALAIVCVLVAVVWIVAFLLPTLTSVRSKSQKIVYLEKMANNAILMEERYAKIKKGSSGYLLSIPDKGGISSALMNLNGAIRQSDVDLTDFYPMPSVQKKCCGMVYFVKPVRIGIVATFKGAMSVFEKILRMFLPYL